VEYAGGRRGITLEEITGGYQLRTKIDNMNFLKGTVKARPFKLSGPALETLSIVAYKQPVVKSEIDQIRGVESGHLLRALMEKGLCTFEGKAENLPGRPMQYGTTRKFLEIFGLRNIKELPTLSQIDELLPEGITEEEAKPTLSMVTDSMSEQVTDVSYSQGEEELTKIEGELSEISTSSDFFEQEKLRQKMKKDADKAQDIRDALIMGEAVSNRDKNWLTKYEESLLSPVAVPQEMMEDESSSQVAVAASENALAENDESNTDEGEDDLPFYDEADEAR
jgi:segregation and condensation protein B